MRQTLNYRQGIRYVQLFALWNIFPRNNLTFVVCIVTISSYCRKMFLFFSDHETRREIDRFLEMRFINLWDKNIPLMLAISAQT